MSESYVTTAIARMVQERPQIQICVRVDHWDQLSQWLLAGELDLYVADIDEARNDSRFHCSSLPSQPFAWFCRADHPLVGRAKVTRIDMLQYPIATPKMPTWAKNWFTAAIQHDQGPGLTPTFPTVECDNYAMLKRMVLAGNCISAALRSTINDELEDGSLSILPLDAPELTTHAGVVRLRDRLLAPIADALISKIEEAAIQS